MCFLSLSVSSYFIPGPNRLAKRKRQWYKFAISHYTSLENSLWCPQGLGERDGSLTKKGE